MNNRQREFEKWFAQAGFDLKAAGDSRAAGNFEWACLQAQQAGEKALKAFLYGEGRTSVITHSVRNLLKECEKADKEFSTLSHTRELDAYYIPTRYPNGLADDVPHEFYTQEDADKCAGFAQEILSLIRRLKGI